MILRLQRPGFVLPFTMLLAVLFLTAGLEAQSNYGSIHGVVRDKTSALVPAATVTVTAEGTDQVRTVSTNSQGEYAVEALQPVLYRIAVTAAGFAPATFEHVKVDTATTYTVNAVLNVAGSVESVTVSEAGSAQLQTENGTSSFTIQERSIQAMPLNGRNTLSLALTLPGASGSAGSEYGSPFNNPAIPGRELIINGGRPGTSQFVADGQSVTSAGLARTTVSFSPDTIQEFTVLESNFSAQYSQAGGAIIQQTTRGGTNQIHGSAYEFYRARAFQATPFDTYYSPGVGNPKPPLQRSQLGIVAGGPVFIPKVYDGRNKTFFFASYEPTRISQGLTSPTFERVPSAEERQGNFCDSLVYHSNGTTTPYPALYNHFTKASSGALMYLPNPNYSAAAGPGATNPVYAYDFTNNIFDPAGSNCANGPGHRLADASGASYLNPASAKLVGFYQQPNIQVITSGSNAGANYEYYSRAKFVDNRYSVRVDQVLPKGNQMFVRATFEPSSTNRFGRDVVMDPQTSDSERSKQIILSETAVIRQNITNNVLIGYNGGDFARNFPLNYENTDGTTPILGTGGTPNPLGVGLANFFNGATPSGESRGFGVLGMSGIQNVSRDHEHTYTASDDLNWTIGRHFIHAGVLGMLQQLNTAGEGAGYLAGGKWGFSNSANDITNCYSGNVTITALLNNGSKCSSTSSSGDTFAAFLEGVSQNLTFQDNLSPTYYYRWFSFGSYVQDDIKVTPNLTINLGLRHQYQSPRWEKDNRQGQLNLNDMVTSYAGLPSPVFEFSGFNGRSKYLDPAQYYDLEPRFGFALAVNPGEAHAIVVRGGYGITHDTLTGRNRTPFPNLAEGNFSGFRAYNPVSGNDGSYNYTNVGGCGWASCQNNLPGQFVYNNVSFLPDPNLFKIPSNGQLTNQFVAIAPGSGLQNNYDARYADTGAIFAQDFKTPYIQNFSLQIQTQLSKSTAFTLGWQGSKGTKLFSTPYDINNNPVTMKTQIPGFTGRAGSNGAGGQIILEDATHSGSIYHALIANLERRFTNGLQFDINYTWGKSLDDSSGGIENDPSGVGGQDSGSQTIQGNSPQTSYGTTHERSLSTFDTPQVFNITTFYELPFGLGKPFLHGGRWMDAAVGGWQISSLVHITSGPHAYVTLGDEDRLDDYIGGGSNYSPRPNIVPGIALKNPDWSASVANTVPYLNPRAFTFQGPAQFGNAPRMLGLTLPTAKQIDGSIFKHVYPFENRQRFVEIRLEVFNLFNWRSFGISGVNTTLTNGIGQNPVGNPNRWGALSPAVWDTFLKGGCPTVSSLPTANGSVDSAATACSNLSAAYKSNFYVLGQSSQNSGILTPRVIQLAAKIYF